MFVRNIRIHYNYPMSSIYGAIKLAIWIDSPLDTTVETRGAFDVPVLTTGHERLRITVLLCARAD